MRVCTNFLCRDEASLVDVTFDEDLCAPCGGDRLHLFPKTILRPIEAVRVSEQDRAETG